MSIKIEKGRQFDRAGADWYNQAAIIKVRLYLSLLFKLNEKANSLFGAVVVN